jgi:hypothetical protein
MTVYKCLYCKKIYNHKSDHKKHENICLKKFNLIIEKYKSYNKIDLISEFFNYDKVNINNYICEKCDKTYTSINGFKNHKMKCKYNKTNIINDNKNITNIQGNQITNNFNNTNMQNNITNNINNNINLITYDDIKYDYIKESVLL